LHLPGQKKRTLPILKTHMTENQTNNNNNNNNNNDDDGTMMSDALKDDLKDDQ
jgi:hypothetical protein